MPDNILSAADAPFSDDFLLKEGIWEKRYSDAVKSERPENWWDWSPAEGENTLTLDNEKWRTHYKRNFPLSFYYQKQFVFGIPLSPSQIRMDFASRDQAWATLIPEKDFPLSVVMEREDYPRFYSKELVNFSHQLKPTDYDNVYSLGNGFCLASTRILQLSNFAATTEGGCWWMVGPESEAATISRRALAVKIYDGPHPFQSRGTDIRLTDPAPLTSASEYIIYSYDQDELKGLYREVFQGVEPEKRAIVISGDDLVDYERSEGVLREKDGQLGGVGKVYYKLPLNATKLLNIYARGSEVELRIKTDDEDWTDWDGYDGRAVSSLYIEASIYSSLSSIRVEWERIRDWEPVGRPFVDVLPVRENDPENTHKIRITGEEGEGLGQIVDVPTGTFTVSADVRCLGGEAIIAAGGEEVVGWNPLDKTIRASGEFSAQNGDYEIILTGAGNFSYEIDRLRLTEGSSGEWIPEDIKWVVETEDRFVDVSDSINHPDMPVSLGEAKRFRMGIKAPDVMDRDEINVNALYADLHKTGDDHILRHVRWKGNGKTRVHYPENVVRPPVAADYIETSTSSSISWQQEENSSPGDVRMEVDGGKIFYKGRFIYRPVTISNEFWTVVIDEDEATVFHQGQNVGTMIGQGLPFRINHFNTEDVQLDCSVGFVQLRRGMGPRFEGWEVFQSTDLMVEEREVRVWGKDQEEAKENLPMYTINIGG